MGTGMAAPRGAKSHKPMCSVCCTLKLECTRQGMKGMACRVYGTAEALNGIQCL